MITIKVQVICPADRKKNMLARVKLNYASVEPN